MPNKPYLPRKDSNLILWIENFISQISLHAEAWSIPQQEIHPVKKALDEFKSFYSITNSPKRTSIAVAQKNEARQDLLELIRILINFRLKNPIITNDQLIALGLNVKDKTRTPIPPPLTCPKFNLKVVDTRRINISFQDSESVTKAKPYGITGGIISYVILDRPPVKHEELTRTVLASRTPYTLDFTEEERGKTVYIAMRWQNKKGQIGTWSEIMSAIIP
jgi:hypothetical protein